MKYIILVIVLMLIVANFKVKAQTCYTQDQINTSCSSYNQCFYLYNKSGDANNGVYKYGSCNSPHKSHPCGTDVSTFIPSFHLSLGNIFTNAKVGTLCTTTPINRKADLNTDGVVNLNDVNLWVKNFGAITAIEVVDWANLILITRNFL